MNRILKLIIIIMIFLTLITCEKSTTTGKKGIEQSFAENQFDSSKPLSWGHMQDIYTFADGKYWKETENILKNTLERKFFTVENEQLFTLKNSNILQFENYYRFKNILFLCDTSSNDPVSEYVKKMMNKKMRDYVVKNKAGIFVKYNLWANDQFIVFIIGDSPIHLQNYTYMKSNILYYFFKEKLANRFAFQNNKSKPIDYKIFNNYPFTLNIPQSYRVFKNDAQGRFISFLWRSKQNEEKNPDKYISVYYEKSETNPITKEWVINTRNKVFGNYYQGDMIKNSDIQHAYYKTNNRKTWIMSGKWQNEKLFMGGTFQSFIFYDEKNKTVYFLDTSVYFPAGYKLKYLLELEGLAKTFTYK